MAQLVDWVADPVQVVDLYPAICSHHLFQQSSIKCVALVTYIFHLIPCLRTRVLKLLSSQRVFVLLINFLNDCIIQITYLFKPTFDYNLLLPQAFDILINKYDDIGYLVGQAIGLRQNVLGFGSE